MYDSIFTNRFDLHTLSLIEDIFVILIMYTFIKVLLLSSLIELIWPTQFFNKRNSTITTNTSVKQRVYTDFLNKLKHHQKTLYKLFGSVFNKTV